MEALFLGIGAVIGTAYGSFVFGRELVKAQNDAIAQRREHAAERADLIAKLAVRTATTPVEQAAQVRLDRRPAPGPSRELSDEEYRKANRNVSPLGL